MDEDFKNFEVSADDLVNANVAMQTALVETQEELEALKQSNPGEAIAKGWEKAKKKTEEAAKAIADAKEKANSENGSIIPDIEKHNKELDTLIDKVYGLGDSFSTTGNVIIDTFGSIADAINNYDQNLLKIADTQEKLAKEKLKYLPSSDEYREISKAETELTRQRTALNLSSYSQIAGAASQMFDEQSKEREALHKLEQVFAAAEIALALQKAAANALTAITNQGSGDPYSAFARIAAMAAIMAALGVFSGSVSGGSVPTAEELQQSQGTGTLLGSDDKSSSIAASVSRFEDIELDQLAELRDIHDTMRDLNRGISQLALRLVAGQDFTGADYSGELGKTSWTSGKALGNIGVGILGGVVGLALDKLMGGVVSDLLGSLVSGLSKTKREVVDAGISFASQTFGEIFESGTLEASVYHTIQTTKKKLFGLVKSESTDVEYSAIDAVLADQMGSIFGHIGDSVIAAAELLGITTVERTTTTINSLWGDLINEDASLFPPGWSDRFFEVVTTTTSQSLEEALAGFQINLPQISFFELSGEEIEKELEAVFSQQADLIAEYLVPSIAEYQKIGEGAYETLLRVAQEQVIFNDALDRMGIILSELSSEQLINVSQTIIDLIGGIDQFKDATSEYFSEFFTEQEQFEYLQRSLTEAMESMNQALPDSRQGFRDLVEGLDVTTDEGQRLFATLLQLAPAAAAYYDELERQADALEDANGLLVRRAQIEASIADALARMDMSELEIALRELNTWAEEQAAEFAALGADTTLLERYYARQRQDILQEALDNINNQAAKDLESLQNEHDRSMATLVSNHESALENLNSSHESAMAELAASFQELYSTISAVSGSIGDGILSIRRSMAGWDEVGYQRTQVNLLQSQIGQGSISDQVSTVESLYEATMARYQAEIAANDALINAANSRYQSELANYDSIKRVVEGLKGAADSLLVSDFSYLSEGDQFAESKSQFESLAAAAKRGDASAISQLEAASRSYLQQAQSYYSTGSVEYGAIFDQVQDSLRSVNGPRRPSAPAEVVRYQNANLAIQETALDELTYLQELLDELNAEALEEEQTQADALIQSYQDATQSLLDTFTENVTSLEDSLAASQAAILAAQEEEIAAIESLAQAIGEIDVAPVVVVESTTSAAASTAGPVDYKPEQYPNPVTQPSAQSNAAAEAAAQSGNAEVVKAINYLRNDMERYNRTVQRGTGTTGPYKAIQ